MQVEGQSYFSLPGHEQMDWARRMIGAIDGPVMNMGSGPPPGFTTDDLARAGYAFTMYAASALSAAANAMSDLFKTIRETGSDALYWARNPGRYTSALELMRAARLDEFAAIEERYSASQEGGS
jgi:2-methylisocitrate lyase-like PEP mutase family enzyme